MNIAVDVDEVVASLIPAWLNAYNGDYNDSLTSDEIISWSIHDFVKPSCGRKIYEYLTPQLYDVVEPVAGALEGILKLRELGHRVLFVTSTPQGCEGAKLAWLKRHGFLSDGGLYGDGRVYPDYIDCSDKNLIKADLLIDDRIENVLGFSGPAMLFDRPHNRTALVSGIKQSVYDWADVVESIGGVSGWIHPTEQKYPWQVKGYREILDASYQLHLKKNRDYSPANVAGAGEIGVVVRMWDKMARLMNLTGFRIEIVSSKFEVPQTRPANESIDDTYLDIMGYSILAQLMRKGVWGK